MTDPTPLAPPTPARAAWGPEIPADVADYTDVTSLDIGNHGNFYVATPPGRLGDVGPKVVLKVVTGTDEKAFRRFTRELKLFNRVEHPNLVQLFDAGRYEDWFFYSMQWCPGGSLDAPAVELTRTAYWTAIGQASRAIHALHEHGIVHRGLRPGNILLRAPSPESATAIVDACVADLGLAQLGGSATAMAPFSSIGYLDPATLLGGNAGRSTDVYSLGAIAHRVITGEHLYPIDDGGDAMLTVRALLRQPPHVRRDLLTAAEADFVAVCVDRDPADRLSTAEEVAEVADNLAAASGGEGAS